MKKITLKVPQKSQENTCAIFKKETPTQAFTCDFYRIFKTAFFAEHHRWLFLRFMFFLVLQKQILSILIILLTYDLFKNIS